MGRASSLRRPNDYVISSQKHLGSVRVAVGMQGTYIKYLTKTKAYSQIIARLVTGARKNRFVSED